jgi:peroxiredoxin
MIVLLESITALLSVLLGAVCWMLYSLLRQNGRLLVRLDAVEAALAAPGSTDQPAERVFADRSLANSRIERSGLTPGTAAPDFSLPTLDGGQATLGDYAGRWLLIVFSDPECKPCLTMLPRLDRLSHGSKLSVLLISRGDPDANRRKLAETGVRLRVALQRHWEISRLYAKFATPIGYLVDPHGRIADDVAMGADAILALFTHAAHMRATANDTSRHTLVH